MSPTKSERLRQRLSIDPDGPAPLVPVPSVQEQAPPATEDAPEALQKAPAPSKGQRKRTPRKTAQSAAQRPAEASATDATDEKPARSAPTVLTPASTEEAKRVGLYLHPDDFRALGIAKLDDGADANARLRAMIAYWRHNERARATIDRLARTAPKTSR